jgi:hypothetical protein
MIALGKRELGPHPKCNLAYAKLKSWVFFFYEKHEMAKQTVSVNTIRLVSRRHSLVLEKAYLVQQPDSLDLTFSIPLVTTPAKL